MRNEGGSTKLVGEGIPMVGHVLGSMPAAFEGKENNERLDDQPYTIRQTVRKSISPIDGLRKVGSPLISSN